MIALSKTLDPDDFEELAPELKEVNRHFAKDREQHPMRRWEYALALRAQQVWYDQTPASRPQGPVIDVGGAGSPFWRMINPEVCRVIDPKEGDDLAEHLRLGAGLASEVYCLSVLEHVDDLDRFLYHLACLTAPGGLLFLTVDCQDVLDQHVAHFHWDRQRIFTTAEGPHSLRVLAEDLLDYQFEWLGGRDLATYHGHHIRNYSFASLALVKRR